MEKEQSAVEQFLSGTENIESPFKEEESNPFEQPIEEQKEEEVVEEEKPLPFYKDPKVQKYIEKQIEKRMPKEEPREVSRETGDEDDYYIRLIGNDTPEKVAMIKESRARDEMMLVKAEERAFNRLSKIEQESIEADREAEEELEQAFENIEENYDVDFSRNSKLRSEFATFVEKIAPKDRNGEIVDYPDMNSAWETFSEIKNANKTPSRAKELASRGMARSSTSEATAPTKRMTFDDFDNILSG